MDNADENNKQQARRQKLMGVVSSAAGDKTIRVVVQSLVKHPMYGKFLRRHTKLAAHDEKNVAEKGDTVEITTCRRISRTKTYRLLRVIKKGSLTEQVP
jgi:small subunit ribosomal protein S17